MQINKIAHLIYNLIKMSISITLSQQKNYYLTNKPKITYETIDFLIKIVNLNFKWESN